jgi:hypothetical protein
MASEFILARTSPSGLGTSGGLSKRCFMPKERKLPGSGFLRLTPYAQEKVYLDGEEGEWNEQRDPSTSA